MSIVKFLGRFLPTLFFIFNFMYADIVLKNDLINKEAENKIKQIGDELFEKTGINLHIYAVNSIEKISILDKEKEISSQLKSPFIVLFLTKNKHKIDIFSSKEISKLFDKEQVLSPYPYNGTILPILTSKNNKDVYSAALLNGYSDIAEQVAKNKNITLENAIGNSNKNTLNILRYFIYGSIIFVILIIVSRNLKDKYVKPE